MTANTSNFYQIGASLPVDAPSYIQRKADKKFYQKLQAGKFCYVLNSRQMGKSSLRVQTMQRLQQEGTLCAAIDLTGIGRVSQQQWYGGIVYNLSESCHLEDKFDFDWQEWWEKHQTILSPVQCLSLFIEKVLLAKIQQPIVIFVDEIDKVLSQDFSLDDFFALIRFFHNQRVDNPIFQRLTFALLGVATPGDLITDKSQTPFNIGEAIELNGFQMDEVKPLINGLEGRFNNPQRVVEEILNWTGGQPFLTQKLCNFMLEESKKDNPGSVKQVVKSRIIENWESQDDPEHLRTIRDRILSSEQKAGYLLELYQQIQQNREITAKKNLEVSELILSGLVVQKQNKLRTHNRIYQQVFNQNWVEAQLKNLRPYSEAFRAWVASGCTDKSRLLRGKALESAEKWAKDKDLSFQDKQFLAASREKDIAFRNKTAELEREKQDRKAAEDRNKMLSEANRKANRKIIIGSCALFMAVLGAFVSVTFAAIVGDKALNAQKNTNLAIQKEKEARQQTEKLENELASTKKDIEIVRELSKLAGELRNENLTAESDEALRQAGLSFRVNDHNLKQAMLLVAMSQAYQNLVRQQKDKNLEYQTLAEAKINESLNNLNKQGNNISSAEGLQIKFLVKANRGKLLANKSKKQAIDAYTQAYNTLKEYPIRTNPFEKNKIITAKNIESVHRGLIELQSNPNEEVEKSLKQHFYTRLKHYLKSENWKAADETTDTLMLFIANREEEGYLDISQIEKFPCSDLQKINKLWVDNSNNNFGFSVQKKIWLNKDNKLDVKRDWNKNDEEKYLRFARELGWYGDRKNNKIQPYWIKYYHYIELVNKNPKSYSGGLPWGGFLTLPKWVEKDVTSGEKVKNLLSRCDL
ncbi:WD-40 repeat-containing protein [Calothrix parasitica NIES-267]|uniref:WD-40 repeat-containing protein n=1 Tax=Calothrix parasitica NIES-267 TaxID=1973488 RepID=A0A1Z4M0R5_9CYAN|nr:WD-40 repeat-containing protein [Calothrix parasitica NIES-267]